MSRIGPQRKSLPGKLFCRDARCGYNLPYLHHQKKILSQPVFSEAVAAYQRGDHTHARGACERVLQLQPAHFDALHLLGVLAAQSGNMSEAAGYFARAVAANEQHPAVRAQLGAALHQLGRLDEALACMDQAITLAPDDAQLYDNRGNILADLERHEEAIASYREALALAPYHADAHNDLGVALGKVKRHDEAIAAFDMALMLEPDFADAHNNRGVALAALRRQEEALASFDRALSLDSGMADAWHGRGLALAALLRTDEAIASHRKALALQPGHLEATHALSQAQLDGKQYAEAIAGMEKVMQVKPEYDFLPGILLQTQLQVCDWRSYDELVNRIGSGLQSGANVCPPFVTHLLPLGPTLQEKASEIWLQAVTRVDPAKVVVPRYRAHPRIRIGYFSPDFRDHPVYFLTAELFEKHDRSRFEITAFSFTPPRHARPARIAQAFDRFVDAHALSDRECAQRARELELDIAVDLAGYTEHSRPDVFALRAAPLQLHYIGYLGTMGADFIDYMIADQALILPQEEAQYSEKILYLPCYQVNDGRRSSSGKNYTRAQWGLPQSGFVYCCFNASKKINRPMFQAWMRILQQVEHSVLWLHQDNPDQVAHLRREAVNGGVDPARLVFAEPLALPDYLARFALADLFLDTLPYNAGATGSDALWAGLPLLTCRGDTFAGRYGASMLQALDLPELIMENLPAYEARAVELGRQPQQLARVREKLAHGRTHGRLFDIDRFTQSVETAYQTIHERHLRGLPPATIVV